MQKISIIVPIYNAGKYLRRCIDSILSQTHNDLEVILVNDGSIDDSKQMCDYYATIDNRIKVIHQNNSGVSVARNVGLDNSTGKYVSFVDADDYIDSKMFQMMIMEIEREGVDMVICDLFTVKDGEIIGTETIDSLQTTCLLEKREIEPNILLEIAGGVCRCLYKKEMLANIYFSNGLKISEDRIFNLYAIGVTKKISYIKEALYYRNIYEESTVHKFHKDYYEIVKKGKEETARAIINAWDGETRYREAYLQQYVYASIRAIENLKHKDSGLSYIKRMKDIRKICQDVELKRAIQVTNYTVKDVRSKWILEGNIFALNMDSLRWYWLFHGIKSIYKREGIHGLLSRVMRKR